MGGRGNKVFGSTYTVHPCSNCKCIYIKNQKSGSGRVCMLEWWYRALKRGKEVRR
jgi:hypothetical protein